MSSPNFAGKCIKRKANALTYPPNDVVGKNPLKDNRSFTYRGFLFLFLLVLFRPSSSSSLLNHVVLLLHQHINCDCINLSFNTPPPPIDSNFKHKHNCRLKLNHQAANRPPLIHTTRQQRKETDASRLHKERRRSDDHSLALSSTLACILLFLQILSLSFASTYLLALAFASGPNSSSLNPIHHSQLQRLRQQHLLSVALARTSFRFNFCCFFIVCSSRASAAANIAHIYIINIITTDVIILSTSATTNTSTTIHNTAIMSARDTHTAMAMHTVMDICKDTLKTILMLPMSTHTRPGIIDMTITNNTTGKKGQNDDLRLQR
ncbi:MAG: hypothetical protein JOS17DRAFT_179199 [Linnemannia elongata]|nr:MAG: hypothetical protein JOS17DRAFT_179199 [Linnemannia elongata]